MESFIEGGYPYQFVENPLDLLICKICQLVSKDPHETTCCHNTFCKACIDMVGNHGHTSCPICRHQPIEAVECIQLRRQIVSLNVFCDYQELGCKWVGEVEAIERHKRECPHYMVRCEYHIVGCNVRVPHHLQYLHNKEKAEDHMSLVLRKVEELDNTKEMLHQTNKALNIAKQELKRTITSSIDELQHAKIKLDDTSEKLNITLRELYNTNKQLKKTNDQLTAAHKELNDTQTKLSDSEDQLNYVIKELFSANQNLTVSETELTTVVSSLVQIKNHIKNNSYEAVKLVALSTQLPMEARILPTVFKMPQYTERKKNNLQWYSRSFYTDNKGYKMRLQVSVGGKGNGRGTHVSVGLCIMRGPHDYCLAWPLRERFKITLLNPELKNHSRIITYNNRVDNKIAGGVDDAEVSHANWCIQFISHTDIVSAGHLIDDCMYFQVETYRAVNSSACKFIFKNFCFLIFCYLIVLLIGMILLQ